jgi:tetratricopeptide (TPR) repeat protein
VFAAGLGFLSDHLEDPRSDMAAACRALDDAIESPALVCDGGTLGLDGPRAHARALVAAAWIERLATAVPCVVVLDDAHLAGSFLVHLISCLRATTARILLVLAGAPEQGTLGAMSISTGMADHTEPDGDSAVSTVVARMVAEAAANPSQAVPLLSDIEPLLEPVDRDSPSEALKLRVAAARVLLHVGEVDRARKLLAPIESQWMAEPIRENLDILGRLPSAMARRSVAVLANLHAIAVLHATVPNSAALGHVQLARLDLLDRLNRLPVADDAKALAQSAVAIFRSRAEDIPYDRWTAERWAAVVEMHTGNRTTAVTALRALHDQQRTVVESDDSSFQATTLALGRALLVADEPGEALLLLDELVLALQADSVNEADALEARHWRAACWIALGREADAAHEMQDVVERRAHTLAADDDRLLSSRQVLGSALARSGNLELAMTEFDRVIREREQTDVVEAAARLDAQASRAGCLTFLGRTDEAIAELDEVIEMVAARPTPGAGAILAKALSSRAMCLLAAGRWLDAIDDLDVQIDTLSTGPADALALLYARHQRAVGSQALGYAHAALRDLNEIAKQTDGWPPNDPFVDAVALQRSQLFSASSSS